CPYGVARAPVIPSFRISPVWASRQHPVASRNSAMEDVQLLRTASVMGVRGGLFFLPAARSLSVDSRSSASKWATVSKCLYASCTFFVGILGASARNVASTCDHGTRRRAASHMLSAWGARRVRQLRGPQHSVPSPQSVTRISDSTPQIGHGA